MDLVRLSKKSQERRWSALRSAPVLVFGPFEVLILAEFTLEALLDALFRQFLVGNLANRG